ncbi:MAG: hypothetical protein KDB14_03790 [Planctomycetales bacterium]|nr:hypothetical protein [Planctomycetales bacterium]
MSRTENAALSSRWGLRRLASELLMPWRRRWLRSYGIELNPAADAVIRKFGGLWIGPEGFPVTFGVSGCLCREVRNDLAQMIKKISDFAEERWAPFGIRGMEIYLMGTSGSVIVMDLLDNDFEEQIAEVTEPCTLDELIAKLRPRSRPY